MPTYEYSCPECGVLERPHSIGTAPMVESCVGCGCDARRVFSAPMLNRTPKAKSAVLARAEKSRHEPEVARRGKEDSHAGPGNEPNQAMAKLVGKEKARELRTAPHPASRLRHH